MIRRFRRRFFSVQAVCSTVLHRCTIVVLFTAISNFADVVWQQINTALVMLLLKTTFTPDGA